MFMKSKLYLLLLASTALLASCTKWIPDNNDSTYIAGRWELMYVDRIRSYGSEPVYTGFENGVFNLSSGGRAEFSDPYGRMSGSWRLVDHYDGYYDAYGNWQSGPRSSLELRLYDNYDGRVIEWEFYLVEISGNRMIGYMNRFGSEYRYEFRRY